MLFERFLRHSKRAAKGKARCSYMQTIVVVKMNSKDGRVI
jgi:hypothetical protein